MIAFAFVLSLCSIVTNAVPNSTELLSAPQMDAPIIDTLPDNSSLQLPPLEMDMAEFDAAEDNAAEGDATEDDAESELDEQAAVSMKLRGSFRSLGSARSLRRRRRRRRKSSFEDPCSGISDAVCETSDYVLCVAGCLGISSCEKACEKSIVKPCYKALEETCSKGALELCEEGIKEAGSESCTEICIDAVATVEAAGGGPEDPAADIVAADIGASCEMSCEAAVETSGLTPGTDAFAEAVCKGIGF